MRTHTHTHIRHHHVHLHCAVPHTSCMAHVFRIPYKMDILAGAPPKKPFSNLFLLFLALSLSLIIFPLTHVCILSIDADIVSVLRYRYAVSCIEIMHQQHTPCCMGCTCTCTTSTWRFFSILSWTRNMPSIIGSQIHFVIWGKKKHQLYCGILFAIIEDLYIMRVNGMERMCDWKIGQKEEKEKEEARMNT